MATIRIENKENNVPEILKNNAMAAQPKRVGLSQRTITGNQLIAKQPLGTSKANNSLNIAINKENIEKNVKSRDEIDCAKGNFKNLVNPIVPVAQFEAFKVYEDRNYEERMARIEEKLKSKIRQTGLVQVYKGTSEDRFYTKTEVAELERKKREEDKAKGIFHPKKEFVITPISSPMNIDKTYDENVPIPEDVFLRGAKSTKDIFFDIEEYREDIYKYLREHELRHRPKAGYMKKQPDVSSDMRTILVDWLVEVAEEYKLHTETLYLAVNYIDRFLSYMSVVRAKLQLVGTAAMFLASKYEEIYPPDIGEFVYITDDTYNKRQVIRMEHLILKVLGFDISIPTSLTFITAICVINNVDDKTKFLAMYLSELSLLNGDIYLEFLPSVIASASIAVANQTLGAEIWNSTLVKSTGYELRHLKAGIEFLKNMFMLAPTFPQHAIQDKYKSQKYMHVSQLKPKDIPLDYN